MVDLSSSLCNKLPEGNLFHDMITTHLNNLNRLSPLSGHLKELSRLALQSRNLLHQTDLDEWTHGEIYRAFQLMVDFHGNIHHWMRTVGLSAP